RVERLFCRNERAVLRCRLPDGSRLVIVAVAAILVAGIRLRFLDTVAMLRAGGSRDIAVREGFARGEEMGWFEHGSTLVVIAEGAWVMAETGNGIRAGTALMAVGRDEAGTA
ncbi:MAG: phosphatidylserine decarboxylase, partial [Gluconacetobacter diazotrophicus]|nr:phosphatidylserine decarboxylase [Gluconacetobacter diazotrophicus]